MDAYDGGFGCYFSCCWDLRFLFCGSIVLSLLICLIRKICNGSFFQDSILDRFWGQSPAGSRPSTDPGSKMQQVFPERSNRAQKALQKEKDLREAGLSRYQDGVSPRLGQDSIRQLLCDNASCSICNKAATEAKKLAYPKGLGFWFHLTPAPPVPVSYQKGCSKLSDVSEMPFGASAPRCASVPCPACSYLHPTSGAPLLAGEGTSSHARDLSGGLLKKQKKEKLTMTMTAKKKSRSSSRELRSDRSRSSSCSEEECFYCSGPKESFHTATSGVLKVSFTSRTDYTSSASGHSKSQEDVLTCSLQIESEASSTSTQAEAVSKKVHRGGHRCLRSHKHRRKRERGRQSGAAQWSQREGGAAVDIPFLEEDVRAKLEWHLLRKRVQHAMGLPLSLIRSLRAFIPLAPDSTRKKPARNVAVLVRPQPLPFLRPEGTRTDLERHLKKMVHLKRWGLPQRVQEALRHMQPSTGHGSPTVLEKEDRRVVSRKMGKTHQQAKDMVDFRPAYATPDWHFQKVAAPEPSYLLGRRHLHPSRVLFSQGKVGDAKSTRERMPFQGSPPTHSLARGATSTPKQPSWMRSSASEAVAVTPSGLEYLESHILQKRVHHQWGLPFLIQRSLEQFLPAPPLRSMHPVLTQHFLWKERTATISSRLPFVHPETVQQLNSHLRSLVVERRWGLPRRVMESLQMFAPDSLLSPEMLKAREVAPSCLSLRRPRVKGTSSEKPPVAHKRLAGSLGSQPSDSHWGQKGHILQRHLAKRALEVQLNIFPPLVQYSQGVSHQAAKDVLPKVLSPGQKDVRHRTGDFLFLEQSARDLIELNITHKNLSYRWGLPTIYTKSLAHFFPGMGPLSSHVPSILPDCFVSRETLFLAKEAREVLEWHIRWKRVQHNWGLPGLALSSLRCLLPAAPQLRRPHQRLRPEEVSVVPGPLLFLSREAKQKLEANVRKRVILQQWGLPKRVLQSLKQLCPEVVIHPARTYTVPGSYPPWPKRRSHHSPSAGLILSSRRRAQKAVPSTLGPKGLKKVKSHLSRRLVEMQLGQPPPVVRTSWRLALLSMRQPLPRLIPPGRGSLRPRNSFLPFIRTEDLQQIGMAISKRHLSSLWGLGLRYVEALTVVVPKPSTQPPWSQRTLAAEFSEVGTPFLPHPDRSALELHVRTKRLQHLWGVPAFLQRSLKAFAEPCLLLPSASPRTELRVDIVQREFLFLPQRIRSHLEMHIQKMKLHRHWGLPSRVLESLKPMRPKPRRHRRAWQEVPMDSSPPGPALADSSHRDPAGSYMSTSVNVRRPKRHPCAAGAPPPVFSLVGTMNLEKIKVRLAKKCVEEQLGAFPAMVKLSWRRASLLLRQPLPKLIPPGQRHLQARSHLVPFGRKEDMDRIAFTIHHKHLMFLWGLGTRYVGALGGMTPRSSSLQPRRPRRAAAAARVMFSEVRIQFLPEREKEILEQQVKRKRIQHLWGFPALIESSVRRFMHQAPSLTVCQRVSVDICIQQREPSFLCLATCRSLELHLQKIKLQHRWGTPGRVLESLNVFLPSRVLGNVGRESRPERPLQLLPPPLSPQEQLRSTQTFTFAEERSRQLKPSRDLQQKMEEQEEEEEEEDKEPDEEQEEEEEEEEKEEEEKEEEEEEKKQDEEEEEEEGEEGKEEEGHQWERETSTQDSLKWEEGSAERSISPGSRRSEKEAHATTSKSPTEPPVSHPTPCTLGMAVRSRTPEKGRKIAVHADVSPKRTPPQRESRGEHQGCTPILLKGEVKLSQPRKTVDKKVSLIGSIVEKKLYLQDGLHIWLRDQERKRTHGKGERSGAGEDQGVWQVEAVSAELHWGGTHDGEEGAGVEKAEFRSDFVTKDSTVEPQSLGTVHLERKHSFQAGRMGSHGGSEGPSMGPASWVTPSRGTHTQVRSSRTQHRAGGGGSRSSSRSRERRRATGPRSLVKGEVQRLVNKEELVRHGEKRLHSKERKWSSKQWRFSSKERKSSSKERKSRSKERKSSSKERKSSSKERKSRSKERKWSTKEWKSSSKERRSSSKERKSRSKERRSSSRKWKLIGKRSSSKERQSSSRRSSSKEGRSRSSSGKRGSKIRKWLFSSRKKKPESKGEPSSGRQGRSRSRGQSQRKQGPSLTQGKEEPRRQEQ
ncbi:hypothetical protein JD844_008041 [Phrynosoma platyrhinos]|uniref:SPATA31 domain-containing protein n=1 Tax=Phrynosoma platyrhinos TaxID=52577 RepID=A0ABQ7TE21_PHRPL|nr:hypothetical protein JD844_008041 [Phrynosoma platyrhinos]